MEDFKEKYILLSKVAKEKKYAQEYLGLLARRGDIGSIRIGKRWYTTWQWFEEFLECSQKKKTESFIPAQEIETNEVAKTEARIPVFIKKPAQVEPQIVPEKKIMPEKENVEVNIPLTIPEKVVVVASQPAHFSAKSFDEVPVAKENISSEIKINFSRPQKTNIFHLTEKRFSGRMEKTENTRSSNAFVARIMNENVPSRNLADKSAARKALFPKEERRTKNVQPKEFSIEERNRQAIPYPEIKLKKNTSVFSPVLAEEEIAPPISRFGLSFSFALMIILLAVSGYFVYSGELLKSGTVAGATDEKGGGFLEMKSESDYFALNAGDKMKESLSVSNVMIEAVKEKNSKEEKNVKKKSN